MTTENYIAELIRRLDALELEVKELKADKAKKQQIME